MKKKLFALSGILMITLVVSGLWATKAINLTGTEQTVEQTETTLASGMSLQQMTVESSLIITGKCLETRSQWIDRNLVTLATVSVTEAIKGASTETVTVVLPGGIDLNRAVPIAMSYPGAPQIAPSEDVFLFLNNDEAVSGGYAVAGFAQGKFSINEDTDGEKVVSRDLSKVKLQRGAGVRRGNTERTSLSEFKGKVKSYLN